MDRDRYDFLTLTTLGSRGKEEAVNKQAQTWEMEMD